MRRILAMTTVLLGLHSLPSTAATDIDAINTLGQAQFRLFSEDLGAALSYKAVLPSEPLGTTGFDLGLEISVVQLSNATIFDQAVSGDAPNTLAIPKLHVHKGLPFDIDVGAFVASVPDSNVRLWGGEVRYAIVSGGPATPAVAVRGSYTELENVNQLKLNTTGVDLSISKGFAFLTPYAGIGKVWVNSTPNAAALVKENLDLNKIFAGLNMNFAFINIAFEADKTGDTTSYSGKVGWRF